ncbi:MAG: response regulator [Myxococcota bacterium]
MQRRKVLIVDDEELVGVLLQRFLRQEFDVTALVDPEEAVARLTLETFDLVVTDFRMPKLSGLDVVKRVRALPDGPPVVVMSGHVTSQEGISEVIEAGAAGFLKKPFPKKAQVQAYLKEIIAEGD